MIYGFFKRLFKKNTVKDKFTEFYRNNIWLSEESRSGIGSSIDQTRIIRQEIPKIVDELGIKVLIDAPCGDFNWLKHVPLDVDKYIGIDIVEEMIAANREKYAADNREFLCLDLINDNLPQADLILCRDCLVHLTFKQALDIIRNFKRSKAKYLLSTTFVNRDINIDLKGKNSWRPLNLHLPPFNFPTAIKIINEGCTEENNTFSDKSLGLWLLEDLKV